jgi:hypothetical protein
MIAYPKFEHDRTSAAGRAGPIWSRDDPVAVIARAAGRGGAIWSRDDPVAVIALTRGAHLASAVSFNSGLIQQPVMKFRRRCGRPVR